MLGLVLGAAQPARAEPITLSDDASVATLAERVSAFANASRVRWIVAAKTRAEAQATIAKLGGRLAPIDRPLLGRVEAKTLAEAAPQYAEAGLPLAWIVVADDGQGADPHACSWQVSVSDPSFPSVSATPLSMPLAPNDRLPVGAAATFRVGHSGLLQSKLYAFDETRPGAIRDLATVGDADIPVAPDPLGETIVLAQARQTAPFLERLKSALAASDGERRDLGKEYALRDKLLGQGRGIGANIQLIPQNMIAAKSDMVASSETKPRAEPLMETCLYALTPAD
ncbi:MAG: hypothetical protein E7774_05355 [Bradyrhizobium sp.]|nr:MAG: hypothetical protein E7774_05355 [Bradyrhizobium sp.]